MLYVDFVITECLDNIFFVLQHFIVVKGTVGLMFLQDGDGRKPEMR